MMKTSQDNSHNILSLPHCRFTQIHLSPPVSTLYSFLSFCEPGDCDRANSREGCCEPGTRLPRNDGRKQISGDRRKRSSNECVLIACDVRLGSWTFYSLFLSLLCSGFSFHWSLENNLKGQYQILERLVLDKLKRCDK